MQDGGYRIEQCKTFGVDLYHYTRFVRHFATEDKAWKFVAMLLGTDKKYLTRRDKCKSTE